MLTFFKMVIIDNGERGTAATQNTTMSTADSWHIELREERREPKDLSKRPHQFFAGLHERAILPEATGRCKRLDD